MPVLNPSKLHLQLQKDEIQPTLELIRSEKYEYECAETHGVPGQKKRKEIAGVMTCWDEAAVNLREVGKKLK